MAYQGIGTGTTPNDNSGDSLLTGAVKINSNFKEVYNALGDGTNIVLTKDRSIIAGAGLTGGGNLNADRTISVRVGSGVTISSGDISVDTSVIRTSGNQTISGNLTTQNITATSFVKSGGTSSQFLKADGSVDTNAYITAASIPGAANNGQLTLEVSGVGLSGAQTFTANQSTNSTFTVTSNATPSGTTSGTLISRGSNGDFSAGSITATSFVKSGGTSSQFLKADGSVDSNTYLTSISAVNDGQLTLQVSGVGLSGAQTFTANQGTDATFTVTSNATSSSTPSTLVSRDGTGSFSAATITATSFVGSGVVPIGGIIMWSGSTASIPTGWRLCNGSNGTPNLKDRFIVGAGSAYNPGDTGGSNTVELQEDELPSHRHTFSMDNERVAGGTGAVVADIRNAGNPLDSGSLSLYRGQQTGYTGGGDPHENRPPYYALAFIMRVS